MEIEDFRAIPVTIPSKKLEEDNGLAPYVTSYGAWESTTKILVRLETDCGIVGWGETYPSPSVRVMMANLEDIFQPELIGRSVWDIEPLHRRFTYGLDRTPLQNFKLSTGAVEMAMWDAIGKYLDMPVYKLLGGKYKDKIELSYCFGILSPEESRKQTRWAIENGYSTIKTKAGRDIEEDVNRLQAIKDEADNNLDIRVDANQALSVGEATKFGARLEDEGIYLQYLEQPARTDLYGGYASLRNRLRQPIAVNEDLYHTYNFYHLLLEDAIDAGVIDLVFAGGILPMKQLAGMAENAAVSLSHHSANDLGIKTAAVIQAVASTPAINLPSDTVYYSLEDNIINDPFEVEKGSFTVPEKPGLGVTIDHEKLEEYRIDKEDIKGGIRPADSPQPNKN